MMHAPSQPEHYEDEEFINLSINLSSSGTNRLSVNLFSTHPEDDGVACPSRTVYQGTQCLRVYYQGD
jgi:hypothetical protein